VISAVGHLWIVDPILRTLEVYAEPFDAVPLGMRRGWREP
jgi:hypothetical protein